MLSVQCLVFGVQSLVFGVYGFVFGDLVFHARVLRGVPQSQSSLKVVVFNSQQPCPDTVSIDLDPLLHSGAVGGWGFWFLVSGFGLRT